MLPAETMQCLRQLLQDVPLDLAIIDGGRQRSFGYIADRMDVVRVANVILRKNMPFDSGHITYSQAAWTH